MKRMMAIAAAICVLGANATVALPEWASGSFKGQVRNWCNDSSFNVYGNASLTVASNGKVSGSITFSDGASGNPTGRFEVLAVSDSEVWITAGFKWYDEKGKADGTSWSDLTIRRTESGVSMAFKDNDDEEEDWEDKCPVEGALERTGAGSASPEAWKKARTLVGVYGEGCGGDGSVEGVAQLKCGKANKKGIAKVSLTVTPFVGKKRMYKAVAVDVSGGGSVEVRWPQQSYAVTINGDGFFGEPIYGDMRPACSPNAVWSADVGGAVTKTAKFYLGDIPTPSGDDGLCNSVYMTAQENYIELPTSVEVKMNGRKWTIAKSANTKWKKCSSKTNCIGDWIVNAKGSTDNLVGLKLMYNAKTGLFKGGFNIYTIMGKKYAAKVTGVVVDGVGRGVATCPKLSADSWCVKVE